MGEKAEVIAQREKRILVNPCLSFIIKIGKDPPVLPEQAMHIPDKIVRVAIQTVVVIVPALVRTELFIGTATDGVAAIETFPFHSTKIYLKIQKNKNCV
jgi:hypothetical protein